MAKSTYSCADCGAGVQVWGRTSKEADRLAAYREKQGAKCDDCQAKDRAAASAAAATTNAAAGLPALTGSEKQVAWAETIRSEILAMLDRALPLALVARGDRTPEQDELMRDFTLMHHVDMLRDVENTPGAARVLPAFVAVVRRQSSARWWIDHRDLSYERIADGLRDEIVAEVLPPAPATPEQREAEEEALLKPAAAPASDLVAEIRLVGSELRVSFAEKNEAFRQAMHELDFHWARPNWVRQLGIITGEPADRMAETAHRLVAAGFMVRLHDDAARAKALSGEFAPEQRRWVTGSKGGKYGGWLMIRWPRGEDLYDAARSLPGSRYSEGAVFVPPGAIEAVAEFAEQYGFAMSDTPRRLLQEHREAVERGAVIVDPKVRPVPIPVHAPADMPPRLEPEAAEVDDELRDAD